MTAVIPLMKKVPKLKDLLIEVDDRPALTAPRPWEEQLTAVRQIMQSRSK